MYIFITFTVHFPNKLKSCRKSIIPDQNGDTYGERNIWIEESLQPIWTQSTGYKECLLQQEEKTVVTLFEAFRNLFISV